LGGINHFICSGHHGNQQVKLHKADEYFIDEEQNLFRGGEENGLMDALTLKFMSMDMDIG
jgi:hypothetical protein